MEFELFVREGDAEVYLKYPLYVNILQENRGPALKVTIQRMSREAAEAYLDEDDEIVLLKQQCIDRNQVKAFDRSCCTLRDPLLNADTTRQSLSEIGGALSSISEKLKALVLTCKSDSSLGEVEPLSQANSPLLSSLNTGTSLDSTSEEQCADSDDVLDSYWDVGSTMHISKHSRTLSDLSSFSSSLHYPQVLGHSLMKADDSWYSQSSGINGQEHIIRDCEDECFVCSSGLHSYEGIHSSLSSSRSISISENLPHEKILRSDVSGLSASSKGVPKSVEEKLAVPVAKKGPSLLKSLFGAVVVAGVSILGARNSSLTKTMTPHVGAEAKASNFTRGRSLKDRYSLSRSARFNF